jgi:hypothetical protein
LESKPPRKKTIFTLIAVIILGTTVIVYYNETLKTEKLEIDYELQSITLEQVNIARQRNNRTALDYNTDPIAQEFAWRLMREEALYHNPDLPAGMSENIAVYTETDIDPLVAVALMIDEMMDNEADRVNLLDPTHTEVSIGTTVKDNSVYLVLCFS